MELGWDGLDSPDYSGAPASNVLYRKHAEHGTVGVFFFLVGQTSMFLQK